MDPLLWWFWSYKYIMLSFILALTTLSWSRTSPKKNFLQLLTPSLESINLTTPFMKRLRRWRLPPLKSSRWTKFASTRDYRQQISQVALTFSQSLSFSDWNSSFYGLSATSLRVEESPCILSLPLSFTVEFCNWISVKWILMHTSKLLSKQFKPKKVFMKQSSFSRRFKSVITHL